MNFARRNLATLALLCGLAANGFAQKTVMTKREGTATTTTVTQKGKAVTGTVDATSANGQTARVKAA